MRQPHLFERERELGELKVAIKAAASRRGCVAVIEGPAGIGKTRLLGDVCERAAGDSMQVLRARGDALEREFSFGVVRQLFEPALGRVGVRERQELLSGSAALAGGLFDAQEPSVSMATGDDGIFALLHGLYWLAVNLAERSPLVVAVDDLHWADPLSLRFVAFLAARVEELPILVSGTCRPAASDEDAALAAVLSDPRTVSVRPAPLTIEATRALLRETLGTEPADEVCSACHDAAGGNPLLLQEIARALAAEGLGEISGAVARVHELAPHAVSRSVGLRLSRLGGDAQALVRAVAVLGDGAEPACAAALAGLEPAPANVAASALARADLLRADPSLSFTHPVLRDAVYTGIDPSDKQRAHGRAAELLERTGAPREQIAAQLLLAPRAARPAAVAMLRAVARRALDEGAAQAAVTYLVRALREPPQPDERASVLLELGEAEARIALPEAVEHLREGLAAARERERRTEIEILLARALFWSQRVEQAVALLEQASEVADQPETRARLDAELVGVCLREPALRHVAAARLAREGRDAETGSVGGRMLGAFRAFSIAAEGVERDRCTELADAALAGGLLLAQESSWSYWAAVYALVFADRLEDGRNACDAVLERARSRGAVFEFATASAFRAFVGLASGMLEDAESDIRTALASVPHRPALALPYLSGWLAQILVERGCLEQAREALDLADAATCALPEHLNSLPLLRSRGYLRQARGELAGALDDVSACGRILQATGVENPAFSPWRSDEAVILLALDRRDEALALSAHEVAQAEAWGAPRALGRALRTQGLAAGGNEGIVLLERSAAVLDGSPALLERAKTQTELGAALRRANRRVEAREHLRAGLDLAQRCGAVPIVERAHAELLASGAKPRRLAQSGAGSLTPSERRIAAMAAEGLANRDIAQALFLTQRTVEMHLTNAFRKLDVTSRTQLAAALAHESRSAAAGGLDARVTVRR